MAASVTPSDRYLAPFPSPLLIFSIVASSLWVASIQAQPRVCCRTTEYIYIYIIARQDVNSGRPQGRRLRMSQEFTSPFTFSTYQNLRGYLMIVRFFVPNFGGSHDVLHADIIGPVETLRGPNKLE